MTKTAFRGTQTSIRFGISYVMLFAIYGISTPYLQLMIRRLGYAPSAVGIFLGLFELIGITGPIVLARNADSRGAYKPYLIASGLMILAGLATLIPFRIPVITIISLSLLSLGLKTPIPVLDAALFRAIDTTAPQESHGLNYGLLRSLGSAGFVIVTLIVQSIRGFDAASSQTMALYMGILTAMYLGGLLFLPETGIPQQKTNKERLSFAWIDSVFITGILVIALGRLAMAAVGSFFSLYLTEELEWHAVGAMWAISAMSEIPFIALSWKFIKKNSPMTAIAIASSAIVVRLLIYALFPSPAGAIAGQLLHSLCYGLFQPAAIVFISLKTPPEKRATGMAIFMGFGVGLPAFVGSALGGRIVELLGYRGLFGGYTLFAVASLLVFYKNRKLLTAVK